LHSREILACLFSEVVATGTEPDVPDVSDEEEEEEEEEHEQKESPVDDIQDDTDDEVWLTLFCHLLHRCLHSFSYCLRTEVGFSTNCLLNGVQLAV